MRPAGLLALVAAAVLTRAATGQDIDGELRATWRVAHRNGRRGADDVTDWRVDRLFDVRGQGLGHRLVHAAATLRTESDLDGLDGAGDPFRDLAHDGGRQHLAELVRAWIEAGPVRLGRQGERAAGHAWRFDGGRVAWERPRVAGVTLFGGRRVSTFADPDRDWLGGGTATGWAWPGGRLEAGTVAYRGLTSRAGWLQEWPGDLTTEGRADWRAEHFDGFTLLADWLPADGALEIHAEWRRRTGRADEVDVLHPGEGEPGEPPDPDRSHLRLEPLAPHDRVAGEVLWLPLDGVEVEAGLTWRRLLHRDRQDLYDWQGVEWLLGGRWRPAGGFECGVEWRRGTHRAPRPQPATEFVNPSTEAIRARDELAATLAWRWNAERAARGWLRVLVASVEVSWMRLDYRSLQRRLRDVNDLAVDVAVEAEWVFGARLRLAYGWEDDFGAFDDETADLHHVALTTGWRF